ncbi:unnamed protein product [Oikopleura dioica]|uniref:Uncharacterized protein n=1 Tax=Oikopleura dioica TaxID=34765 RepID=E4WQL8_OIKDI|nr:unnamed protein product [Oikopleura dioica]CBY36533.1 unnamed protein product [Oikopleura dioica]CBY36872.1 unnamed protein product [Oikopleura dioica]
MVVYYEEIGQRQINDDQDKHISNYILITEIDYHRMSAAKDRVDFIIFPMILLAIQIIMGLRQFVDTANFDQEEGPDKTEREYWRK